MLIGARDHILLGDFGLFAPDNDGETSQKATGTVAYMAPEQLRGNASPISDQYALGIVIYEWLCGDCPFHGSVTEVATQHALSPPPSLHEQLPSLSDAVEQAIMKALSKDPQERYPSVLAFFHALEAASHAESITALAWSPDGKWIASGSYDNTVQVWALSTRKSIYTYQVQGEWQGVADLAWSPDGQHIVICGGLGVKTAQSWDTMTGRNVVTYNAQADINTVGWSPL